MLLSGSPTLRTPATERFPRFDPSFFREHWHQQGDAEEILPDRRHCRRNGRAPAPERQVRGNGRHPRGQAADHLARAERDRDTLRPRPWRLAHGRDGRVRLPARGSPDRARRRVRVAEHRENPGTVADAGGRGRGRAQRCREHAPQGRQQDARITHTELRRAVRGIRENRRGDGNGRARGRGRRRDAGRAGRGRPALRKRAAGQAAEGVCRGLARPDHNRGRYVVHRRGHQIGGRRQRRPRRDAGTSDH